MGTIEPQNYILKTGENALVRSARPQDAGALIELTHTVMAEGEFMVTTSSEFQMTVEQEERWIQLHALEEGKILLVLTVEEQVIGMINFKNGARRRLAHQGDFGMSVRKEWRGRGVGSALLEALINWGKANPLIEQIRLAVLSTNEAAIHLYTRMGFVQEGRLMNQAKLDNGTYCDLILMAKFMRK